MFSINVETFWLSFISISPHSHFVCSPNCVVLSKRTSVSISDDRIVDGDMVEYRNDLKQVQTHPGHIGNGSVKRSSFFFFCWLDFFRCPMCCGLWQMFEANSMTRVCLIIFYTCLCCTEVHKGIWSLAYTTIFRPTQHDSHQSIAEYNKPFSINIWNEICPKIQFHKG